MVLSVQVFPRGWYEVRWDPLQTPEELLEHTCIILMPFQSDQKAYIFWVGVMFWLLPTQAYFLGEVVLSQR